MTPAEARKFFDKLLPIIRSRISTGDSQHDLDLICTRHFFERISERLDYDDLKEVFAMVHEVFVSRRCELIYASRLDPKPIRFSIVKGNYAVGLTFNGDKCFMLRTVVNDRRWDGVNGGFIFKLV